MTIVGYGLGRDSDVLGSFVAYGLGRKVLTANIVNGVITFSTDLDITNLSNLFTSKEISFDTELDYGTINKLFAESQFDFTFNADINVVRSNIVDADTIFGLNLSLEAQTFLLRPGLVPSNLYIIPEEIRTLPVYVEIRECAVGEEARIELIKFEDRVVIVIPKYVEV